MTKNDVKKIIRVRYDLRIFSFQCQIGISVYLGDIGS